MFICVYLWLRSFLGLIYPPYCLHCHSATTDLSAVGTAQAGNYLCPDCVDSVKPIDPQNICLKCGMFLGPHSGVKDDCPSCRTMHFSFMRTLAYGNYEGVLKDLILQYKYGREKLLADPLAKWLVECLQREKDIAKEIDLIVPVPLTKSKQKKRGFNQSELLASRLAREFSGLISINNLVRIKDTPAQAGLSRSERIRNLKDAFAIRQPDEFRGKSVLLIDDVLTTGATAGEVSRMLKKAGARSIYILVLAR